MDWTNLAQDLAHVINCLVNNSMRKVHDSEVETMVERMRFKTETG